MPAEKLDTQARELVARYTRVMLARYPERVKLEADRFFTSESLSAHLNEFYRELFKPHSIPEVVRQHIQDILRQFEDDQFRAEVIDAYDWVWPAPDSRFIAELLRSEWKIIQFRGEPFVTSDRPVWIPHIDNRDTFELWFPVSPNYILAAGDGISSYTDERPARTRNFIAKFPFNHFRFSDRFVYSRRITSKQKETLTRYKQVRPRVKRRRKEYIQARGL